MKNKFDYILSHFKAVYGLDFPVDIAYGVDGVSKIQIAQGSIGFFDNNKPLPPDVIWKEWSNEKIPFLFDGDDNKEILSVSDGQMVINYDIVAASFYFLSGWQEYKTDEKDELGRFPYSKSIQSKLDIVELPVVNYYFDILKKAIEQVYNTKLKVKLWGESDFATFISHDIDLCESGWMQGSVSELKQGRLLSPFVLLAKKIFTQDVWFNFDEIIEIEKRYKAKSTFYFLCENEKVNNYPNADYDISDRKFLGVFDQIRTNGSEVGIHGSLGTGTDAKKLISEINKIKGDITGIRFHALGYDIHKTPTVIEAANLKYDTTSGFAEHIGFRNSFCFPFFPYDIAGDKPYTFLEIPFQAMDATLHASKYMGLSKEDALDKIRGLIREIKKFNGCFGLLWHNNFVSQYKYAGWGEVFEDTLRECVKHNTAFLTGNELYEQFKVN